LLLGICYWGGLGVAVDRDQAISLFFKSADQGNEQAKAVIFKMGEGILPEFPFDEPSSDDA
jgi:TPR repeat protein